MFVRMFWYGFLTNLKKFQIKVELTESGNFIEVEQSNAEADRKDFDETPSSFDSNDSPVKKVTVDITKNRTLEDKENGMDTFNGSGKVRVRSVSAQR